MYYLNKGNLSGVLIYKGIIFIHTCELYEHTRAKLLESTWANNEDIVFITDNENSELNNNIYIGPYIKGPTYHPENVKKMFDLFLNKYADYDFFMIIDDDSYVYVDKLKSYLSFFNKDEPYMIGDFVNWTNILTEHGYNCRGNYNNWIGGGCGIVFTKTCMSISNFIIHTISLIRIMTCGYIIYIAYQIVQLEGSIAQLSTNLKLMYYINNIQNKAII